MKYAFIFVGIAGIVLLVSFSTARTSTTGHCIPCHDMKAYKEDLQKSSHALDEDKNPIECHQCHIPQRIGPRYVTVKSVLGMRDMFIHYFADPEHLDRRRMQEIARRFIPDENCLMCHSDLMKNAKKDGPISEIGKLCHEASLGPKRHHKTWVHWMSLQHGSSSRLPPPLLL